MSIVIINSSGIERELEVFKIAQLNIKDIFARERLNLQVMNNGHSWVGKTQMAMYNKQLEFQQNFEPIEEALQVFIDFIQKALDDYYRFEQTQLQNQVDNSSNLNVNS